MQKLTGAVIRVWLMGLFAMVVLSGCVVHPAHHRHVVVAKPVPKTVVVKQVVVKKPVVVRKVVVH
ncbi:hypothetical protein [Rheinheimera sp. F8]|uniref:hypothetical protein n=1 Tax=Rheinheimera sp. F8 TaxID=1763998 RepID=UPI000744B3B1|nr:hypothetical protein [Rheinheimera sp. F8]ALZ75322.1 hypothetical protein ATY27_05840 [Rheinheimera sp. F8]ALZ75863.1 hypothetical protein ATY27_08860 [Rheinheimera sp. F8]